MALGLRAYTAMPSFFHMGSGEGGGVELRFSLWARLGRLLSLTCIIKDNDKVFEVINYVLLTWS